MKFSEFAGACEELEKQPSKLKKVAVIAELLKKSGEDLYMVTTLLQGRVFPSFDEREVGLAAQSLEKIIAQATGFSSDETKKRFSKIGDFGLVAEELAGKKKQRTLLAKPLTVRKVFENLQKTAGIDGKGSQERKFALVAELLSAATPVEAKYITRATIGDLRIGVAEGTIRDAIARAFLKTDTDEDRKAAFSAVEWAWFLRPDYGEIAEIARDRGLAGLEKVRVEVGKPYHVLLAERSPGLKEAIESFEHPALEFKYDGARCVSGDTPVYVKLRGMTSIEDVNVGDYVLTHTGHYRRVIANKRRIVDNNERIFVLQSFLGNEFKITEKHSILVSVDGKNMWMPIEDVPDGAELVFPVPKIYPAIYPKKIMTLESIDGYRKTFRLNRNFYRFLGFWIGDGYTNTINKTYRIGLMFNGKTELGLLDEYKKIAAKEFGIKNLCESDLRGARCLYWTDRPLQLWLSENFRHGERIGWKGKNLPEWFWNVSRENFVSFMKGWEEADGHEDDIGRKSIITKERNLASFAQLIGLKHGIIMGVRRLSINGGTYYKIIIPKGKKHARISGSKLFIKILKKKELNRTGRNRDIYPYSRVFNIQVEGDESYCSNFVTMHNCTIHKKGERIWLFTRRLENITKQFPELREMVAKAVSAEECIIEGEMLGFNKATGKPMPFQFLSQRIKRKYDIESMAKEIPIQVNLFEIVYLDGRELFDEPLHERWKKLKSIIKPIKGKFQLAEHLETKDLREAERFYKQSLAASQEGLIVKNMDAPYQPGRRVAGGWLKVKPVMETLDLAIVGATWGTGKRAGWFGSLLLGARDAETGKFLKCGMIGTGIKEKKGEVEEGESEDMTFEELTKLLKPDIIGKKGNDVVLRPNVIVEVAYEEIQESQTYDSGVALRFPRVLKFRPDKALDEVDSVDRLKSLYDQQKGKIRG